MRLNRKISLGICLLVVALLASVIVVADRATTAAIEGRILKDLAAARKVFDHFQQVRFRTLLTYNHIAAEVPHLKAIVTMPEIEDAVIARISKDVQEQVQSDLFMIYDAAGRALVSGETPHPSLGGDSSRTPAVRAALGGQDFQGIWIGQGRLEQIVSNPIRFGREIGGVLLTGFTIGPKVMDSLEQMTNARAAIFDADRVYASTERNALLFEKLIGMLSDEELSREAKIVTKTVDGERYLFHLAPFGGGQLYYVLARSLDEELAFYRELSLYLLGMAGIILLIALAIGLVFSRRITRPLESLAQGTQRIASGDFDSKVEIYSRDEIGELAGSFNRMTQYLKESREALVAAKDYLDNIFRSMVDTLIVMNPNGIIQQVNRAACEVLGFQEHELIGKPIQQFFDTTGKPWAAAEFAQLMKTGGIPGIEEKYKGKDGKDIPIWLSVSVIRDGKGNLQGIVFAAEDITEKKKLEARVFQSEKMAAVGQLAGGVAHEINNPLGIMLGFAQGAMRRMKDDDPAMKPLKVIERECVRCKILVQDLLTFSRVGKPEKENVDLNQTLEGAMSLIMAQQTVKHVDIRVEPCRESLPVQANAMQIQQIVINLANNGMDAMKDGGKLFIRTMPATLREKPAAELQVQDTGTGIPEDIRKRIFEPFFTTKDVGQGTGLGLSLVYEIIKKHDGEVLVESEPGRGTLFRVLLPLAS